MNKNYPVQRTERKRTEEKQTHNYNTAKRQKKKKNLESNNRSNHVQGSNKIDSDFSIRHSRRYTQGAKRRETITKNFIYSKTVIQK